MASRRQRTEGRIRLAVVDDHQLLRAGVRTLLEEEPDLEVAAEVAHGNDICELIRRTKVDVLLLDLDMPPPDGHEVLRRMKRARLGVRTIILTGVDDPLSLALALELGARGNRAQEIGDEAVDSSRPQGSSGRPLAGGKLSSSQVTPSPNPSTVPLSPEGPRATAGQGGFPVEFSNSAGAPNRFAGRSGSTI